jgi:hypothetical protein
LPSAQKLKFVLNAMGELEILGNRKGLSALAAICSGLSESVKDDYYHLDEQFWGTELSTTRWTKSPRAPAAMLFYNTNELEHGAATASKDVANYYTLSYSPANTKFDGSPRKIRVNLAQKSCHLSYRRSYFADHESALKGKADGCP